jgi:adenylate cyclase class 2
MAPARMQEIEAKFPRPDLESLRKWVVQLGGQTTRRRVFERNLRFDTHDGRLRAHKEILRLRHDLETVLSYKQQGESFEQRREIEVRAQDPEGVRALLEALGFEVAFIYEKYRQVLVLDGAEVMLDELPFGNFVEVEAADLEQVRHTCNRLEMDWGKRLRANYQMLFEAVARELDLEFRDATFSNFAAVPRFAPEDLEATYSSFMAGDVA